MINTIKQFIEYKQYLKLSQLIDIELTEEDKIKLNAIDKKLILKIYNKLLQRLSSELISGDLTPDFVRGSKFSAKYFKEIFKDYKI